MRKILLMSLVVFGQVRGMQQSVLTTTVVPTRSGEQIVINIQEPQINTTPPSPGSSRVKVAWIAAGSAIISSLITAAVTLGITLGKCT